MMLASMAYATTTIAITAPSAGADLNRLDIYQDINFTITSDDSNFFMVDLNYSSVNTQGTGTVIINDVNTSFTSGLVICDGTLPADGFESGVSCSYNWNFSNVDSNTYFINAEADGGPTSGYDPINSAVTISSTYTATYAVTDISTEIIDFMGFLLVALVTNAPLLVTLIILGMIVYLLRDMIRALFGMIMDWKR